jgi:NTP pyrophosphatase (non-canonical NTP hydrolase)
MNIELTDEQVKTLMHQLSGDKMAGEPGHPLASIISKAIEDAPANHRYQIDHPDDYTNEIFDDLKDLLKYRLEEKGNGIYVSSHEILGIIGEEWEELIQAVHNNDTVNIKEELRDIAVGCIWAMVSINSGKMHWM